MSAAYPRNVTNIIPLELIVVKKEPAPRYIDANPCIKVILINKRDNIIQYANVFLFIIYSNVIKLSADDHWQSLQKTLKPGMEQSFNQIVIPGLFF